MVRPVVQLLILLLAIPAQYLISLWTSPGSDQTSIQVLRVLTALQGFCKKWFNPANWLKELEKVWLQITDDQGQCIAVEVMKYRSREGHFTNSPKPRTSHPGKVKYRIGQVFQHKSRGYHGVIIGWDEHAKAPDQWFDDHGEKDDPEQKLQPHYAVLPDEKDSPERRDYVRQDDIEIVSNRKIMNEVTVDYFEGFDGVVYLPRPFLKELYPED